MNHNQGDGLLKSDLNLKIKKVMPLKAANEVRNDK